MSFLDECNFEARHIMRVSGDKSESSNRSHSRRLSEVKVTEDLQRPNFAKFFSFAPDIAKRVI